MALFPTNSLFCFSSEFWHLCNLCHSVHPFPSSNFVASSFHYVPQRRVLSYMLMSYPSAAKFSVFLVKWVLWMVRDKNYETMSYICWSYAEKTLASFFWTRCIYDKARWLNKSKVVHGVYARDAATINANILSTVFNRRLKSFGWLHMTTCRRQPHIAVTT